MKKRVKDGSVADEPDTSHAKSAQTTPQQDTILCGLMPTPACCLTPKYKTSCRIFKYIYIAGFLILGLALAGLKLFDEVVLNSAWGISDALDTFEQNLFDELKSPSNIPYLILALIILHISKAFAVKDPLSLRVNVVVLVAWHITTPNHDTALTLFVSILIVGCLSSLVKLIEYRAVGAEVQVVVGAPAELGFTILRRLLMCFPCVREDSEEKIDWIQAKYTFEVSEMSRDDVNMDLMSNIDRTLSVLFAKWKCCCGCCGGLVADDEHVTTQRKQSDSEQRSSLESKKWPWHVLVFLMAALWASMVEWVQPFSELFIWAHNWEWSTRNAAVLVLSELCDLDKIVTMYIFIRFQLNGADGESDYLGSQIANLVSKGVFLPIGWLLVMPVTLRWMYWYHHQFIQQNVTKGGDNYKGRTPDVSGAEKLAIPDTSSNSEIGSGTPTDTVGPDERITVIAE